MTAVAPTVEDRLDRLTEQVEYLVTELETQRRQREQWQELTHDLAPVASQAMASATRELESLSREVDLEHLARFAKTLARSLPALEATVAQLTSLGELGADVSQLTAPALANLTARLADLEERGYFAFAREGVGVVDRVVTSFTDDDVKALGDNIVLILETIKEMTQPEVMTMLRRTLHTVQEAEEPEEAPSMLSLLKEMRDPQVRMGLARVLNMLRSVGEDRPGAANS